MKKIKYSTGSSFLQTWTFSPSNILSSYSRVKAIKYFISRVFYSHISIHIIGSIWVFSHQRLPRRIVLGKSFVWALSASDRSDSTCLYIARRAKYAPTFLKGNPSVRWAISRSRASLTLLKLAIIFMNFFWRIFGFSESWSSNIYLQNLAIMKKYLQEYRWLHRLLWWCSNQ